jgi:hypothetical protein
MKKHFPQARAMRIARKLASAMGRAVYVQSSALGYAVNTYPGTFGCTRVLPA